MTLEHTGRSPRICVIAAGHITTSPRVMKAATALHGAGFEVRIVASSPSVSLEHADSAWLASRSWEWDLFRYDRATHRANYVESGLRYRISRRIARSLGAAGRSTSTLGMAVTRPFRGLLRAAAASGADLFYGGTVGGLAVAAEAARITGRPYALDLEDFHSEEADPSPDADLTHAVVTEVERRVLGNAAFLTCGSDAIAGAYEAKYGVRPTPINNVFPLPTEAPDFSVTPGDLRVLWLSQTVGPGRGLEDAIRALGLSGRAATLTLRGNASPEYSNRLRELAREAPLLRLIHEPADMTRTVVELCSGYDVGLALEQGHVLNRRVCLPNKPFSYMVAGLSVILTDTEGQRALARELGNGGRLLRVGDVERMAECLREWADHPDRLEADRRAAWSAAKRRWHWDHPEEKGKLLGLFAAALKRNAGKVSSSPGESERRTAARTR